ncbi:MAG TPA: hypothetical protein VM537_01610 [Anaerolineae bacterium]|nr:hypothetical protein [Anaerolineae bacterium]
MTDRKPMEPVAWMIPPGDGALDYAKLRDDLWPEDINAVPLYTADQIRSEIEAVRAKYPIARDGELAAIVHHALDALGARMGIDTPTEKRRG